MNNDIDNQAVRAAQWQMARYPDRWRLLNCIFIAATFSGPSISLAQTTVRPNVVEVDSITGGAISSIPFDEPFVLKVRSDQEPTFAFAIISHGNESAWEILKREDERARATGEDREVATLIDRSRISLSKEGGRNYVLVQFIEPRHRVGAGANLFVIFNSAETQGFEVLKLWHDGSNEPDSTKAKALFDKAKAKSTEIRTKQKASIGFNYLAPTPDELGEIYDALDTNFTAIDAREAACIINATAAKSINITNVAGALLKEALLDTLRSTVGCLVDCDLEKDLVALSLLDPNALELLVLGKRTLRDPKPIGSPAERLAALKNTRTSLNRMIAYQQARGTLSGAAISGEWASLVKEVDANVTELDSMSKERKAISDVLNLVYAIPRAITGTTQIYSFDTRSSFRMIPDFGLVWYGFQDGFSDVIPYFGVQFNVRQSKKNIPWRHYPKKTFWHHVSFSIGYTTQSLAADGEREDFFTKSSLMVGAGWRLTDELRVTGGALCFYGEDPNPAIESRQLQATPYLGLSVDLDIAKYLNDLAKILKP